MEPPWHLSICETPQGHVQYRIDTAFLKATVWYDHTHWK